MGVGIETLSTLRFRYQGFKDSVDGTRPRDDTKDNDDEGDEELGDPASALVA